MGVDDAARPHSATCWKKTLTISGAGAAATERDSGLNMRAKYWSPVPTALSAHLCEAWSKPAIRYAPSSHNSFGWGWLDTAPPEILMPKSSPATCRSPRCSYRDAGLRYRTAPRRADRHPYSYPPWTPVDRTSRHPECGPGRARPRVAKVVSHLDQRGLRDALRSITEEHPLQGQSPYSATKIGPTRSRCRSSARSAHR